MDSGEAVASEFMGFVTRLVTSKDLAGEEGRVPQEDAEVIVRIQAALQTVVGLQQDIVARPVDPALQYYVFHCVQALGTLVDGLTQLREQDYRRFRKDVTERLKRLEDKPREPAQGFF